MNILNSAVTVLSILALRAVWCRAAFPRLNENEIVILDFTSPSDQSLSVEVLDDPVLGGTSHSSFRQVGDSYLLWKGTVAHYEPTDAPGFCTLHTAGRREDVLSVLQKTESIAFYITKDSHLFSPMGINLENEFHSYSPMPIAYWAPAQEESVSSTVLRLSAQWKHFTANAFAHPVPAPPLNATYLATANRIGLTTYMSNKEGDFSLHILGVTATPKSTNTDKVSLHIH